MHSLYNISVRLYAGLIFLASFLNKKARLWREGRKDLLEKIALSLDQDDEHVWFHCASLGEFEQGRPVMEKFKKDNPGIKLIVTFYSPSGYEVRKNFAGADYVFYMPLDTPANASRFVQYVKPRLAVFVKYEYWYNHLDALHARKVPVVFISAVFRKNQVFFKWWGSWFRKQLKQITYFFVQDKTSQQLLYDSGITNVVVSGDTRFDRVFAIRNNPINYSEVEKFIQGSIIFMGGSTWPADDKLISGLTRQKYTGIKYILAPHEMNEKYIDSLKQLMEGPVVKLSEFDEEKFKLARVLIIDQIGMLSSLYQYASVAYIGGGFGKGIHNILEAATYGMPVIFGPNYKKFAEARELVEFKGAFPVNSAKELQEVTHMLLSNYKVLNTTSQISKEYVTLKKGATDKIMVFLNAIINPGTFRAKAPDLLNLN